MKRIFVFGAGLHGLSCIDAIEQQQCYEIIGIIDSKREIGSSFEGYPVIGRQEELLELASQYNVNAGFIAIGENWVRKLISEFILGLIPQFEFVNVIHPTAVIGKEVHLGKGLFIGAQSFVSARCTIGSHCLIHQKAHIGIENLIEEFASVSIGSITGGKVVVGMCSAVTLGVIVHSRLAIGAHTIVGSGAIVTGNLPPLTVCYGQPAKVIRPRVEGEAYFRSN